MHEKDAEAKTSMKYQIMIMYKPPKLGVFHVHSLRFIFQD